MYFKLLALRQPSQVETCYQSKDTILTNCVDSNLFLLLLYLTQQDDKHKKKLIHIELAHFTSTSMLVSHVPV
jgi:hypothetical protein